MDPKKIIRAAKRQGWTEKPLRKGVMLVPPDASKQAVTWHGSPSDVRAVRNFLALMRGSGLIWPPP
jgi:hypothetical protein